MPINVVKRPPKKFTPKGWTWGKHENPADWHDTADIIQNNKKKPTKHGHKISE